MALVLVAVRPHRDRQRPMTMSGMRGVGRHDPAPQWLTCVPVVLVVFDQPRDVGFLVPKNSPVGFKAWV